MLKFGNISLVLTEPEFAADLLAAFELSYCKTEMVFKARKNGENECVSSVFAKLLEYKGIFKRN